MSDRSTPVWGFQLPIQSQSSIYCQPWEAEASAPELASVAVAAESAGANYIAVCDHVAIPAEKAEAMGAVWYDTVATLGWLAAQTSTVQLLSHILVLPYRSPLVAAKSFSTLDVLSNGRMIMGVGAGHVEGEFELLDADFNRRGPAMDEAIPIIREAFETGAYRDARVEPRSPRPGGPPIWVGGSSPAAIRRATELADGWLPQGPPKVGMATAVEQIRHRRAELFGPDDRFSVGMFTEALYVGEPTRELAERTTARAPSDMGRRLAKYLAVGADQIQVRFDTGSCDELVDQLGRFGTEVWPEVLASL